MFHITYAHILMVILYNILCAWNKVSWCGIFYLPYHVGAQNFSEFGVIQIFILGMINLY